MSLNKSATVRRRIGLLAGSSLVAASLAFTGAALAPATAFAADECTPVPPTLGNGPGPVSDDPTLNLTAADSFSCPAGTYATGITYSSNGALTVTAVGAATVTADGVNLTGNGADAVTWDSTAGSVSGGAGTAGPVIDVTAGAGAITISAAALSGAGAGTTHAVRAVGGGNIFITESEGWSSGTAANAIGIEARSTGGNVTIVKNGTLSVSGVPILANATGNITITNNGGSIFTNNAAANPSMDLTAGGNINLTMNASFANGTTRATAGGTVSITLTAMGTELRAPTGSHAVVATSSVGVNLDVAGQVNGSVNFSEGAGAATVITRGGDFSQGIWKATGNSVLGGGNDVLTMQGKGFNTLTSGSIGFGGGADTFNVAGTRAAALTSSGNFTSTSSTLDFGAGADVLNVTGYINMTGGALNFGADADTFNLSGVARFSNTAIDFGTGVDALNQDGVFLLPIGQTFLNLEAFNNAADIMLGGVENIAGALGTDGTPGDVLRMNSGVFTGSGDSVIWMDANLGVSGSQLNCSTGAVSDCANFTGAATAGSTLLRVKDGTFTVDGGTLGVAITLVEGATAAEHFLLDPASLYYAESPGGQSIRKPVVEYRFIYDAATKRHMLIGAPGAEMFEVASYAASAQEAWRETAGSWMTRQADLRATPGGLEGSRGVWARVGGQAGERELGTTYAVQGLSLDYDLDHKQKVAHLVFGADLLGGLTEDSAWVLGGMIGYVRGDVEFEATPTEMTQTGATGGLYASYVAGPLFIDAVLNANVLHVKTDAPAMNLGLDVPMGFDLTSVGGQVEGGWRIPLASGLFVEPLAGVSYVITSFEEAEVPGGSGVFNFADSKSLRVGAGARLGMDAELLGMAASYSLTGRYWKESEGEGSATVTTASGSSALLPDEFAGEFSELAASVNLYSGGGGVSGFVNLGGRFADGYQSVDGSVGVRVRW